MVESKTRVDAAAAQRIPKSSLNLARWIHGQCVLASVRGPIPGTTLNLAKAHKALLRADMPGDLKEALLGELRRLLRSHADAAEFASMAKRQEEGRLGRGIFSRF